PTRGSHARLRLAPERDRSTLRPPAGRATQRRTGIAPSGQSSSRGEGSLRRVHDDIVFVDADDTLWENYRFFVDVIDEWKRVIAGHGVDPARAEATLHAVEDRNIPTTGYGAAPFVRSVVEA